MKKFFVFALIGILFMVSVSAGSFTRTSGTGFSTYQSSPSFQAYSASDMNTYWPILGNKETCEARQDVLLQISPIGCTPQVVRSDLLAEQNVPVFCQVEALKINPLIDIKQLKSIRFTGTYPDTVVGTGFHPAQAALKSTNVLLGNPVLNNVGYVVVVLKKTEREDDLPDFVSVNLTANLEYNAGNVLGIGKAEFILSPQTDAEWEQDKAKQSFWQGKYSIRLEEADSEQATITIYSGDRKISTTRIGYGETSKDIYVPGLYCNAGLNVKYTGLQVAEDMAKIQVSSDSGTDVLEVYEGSKFLDGKCTVQKVDARDIEDVGAVEIKCGSNKLRLELKNSGGSSINRDTIIDDLDLEVKACSVGSKVPGSDGKCYKMGSKEGFIFVDYNHLFYSGSSAQVLINGNARDKSMANYGTATVNSITGMSMTSWWALPNMVLVQDKTNGGYYLTGNLKDKLSGGVFKFLPNGDLVYIPGNTGDITKATFRIKAGGDINVEGNWVPIGSGESSEIFYEKMYTGDSNLEDYFERAIDYYTELAENYPLEKSPIAGTEGKAYAQGGLEEAIELAQKFEKTQTLIELVNLYKKIYPEGDFVLDLNRFYTQDTSLATGSVNLNNEFYTISLVGTKKPKIAQNAEIIWGDGQKFSVELENMKEYPGVGKITLNKLDVDNARVSVDCEGQSTGRRIVNSVGALPQVSLKVGVPQVVCGKTMRLEKVNVETVAKVSIGSVGGSLGGETNLTVNIGIEKRAIKLSPEKTTEMIDNLNESIDKWGKISDNLDKVVTGLKGACFATSAALTIKNFFTGLDGTAIARQKVMRTSGGWNDKCAELLKTGEKGYASLDACYFGERDNIEKDVKIVEAGLNQVNNKISGFEEGKKTPGFLGLSESVDRNKVVPEYADYIRDTYGNEKIKVDGKEVLVSDLIGADTKKEYEDGRYGYEQLRDLELNLILKEKGLSEGLQKGVTSDISIIGKSLSDRAEVAKLIETNEKLRSLGIAQATSIELKEQRNFLAEVVSTDKMDGGISSSLKDVNSKQLAYSTTVVVPGLVGSKIPAGKYLLGLEKLADGTYTIKKVVRINPDTGEVIPGDITSEKFIKAYNLGNIVAKEGLSYNNKYTNPEIRFYESGVYKGLPALVPFDRQNGWYVATKPTLSAFGNIGAFEASGKVASFWLCNVGKDGREQFTQGLGDDICQLINVNTGQALGSFPELSESEARKKVSQGITALQDAANQYKSGKKQISIAGDTFKVGSPAALVAGTQCQEFMSASDCNILFNVCDPVICPSSRCDLGGRYQVADVIQTGIVGSALLCLPNSVALGGDVYIPVCLTGIKAGVDGFVSILESHRDCLQESLDTGKSVGICDEIYSVYLCEFMWRQVAVFADELVPAIVESVYGQGTKGGGEYMGVQSAWDNAKQSVDYFTQTYAVNSMNAFQARNVQEAGGEICKAFVSAKAPTSIDTLLQADSPTQFHAWFDSATYSDVTVPATSRYKVFYHIFAGNDQGVYYTVYLKGIETGGYYSVPATVTVDSGFIGRGETADETKDFTAPEGYKELCVRINNEEKCGFKQVSTSFAVNYLTDLAVNDTLMQTGIVTQTDCISGSGSLTSLSNLNVQGMAEEALNGEIYNRGIVRICSTDNPGKTTDPARYVNVGYCDEQKVGCWLDKQSVNNAITESNKGVKDSTLSALEQAQQEYMQAQGIWTEEEGRTEIERLGERRDALFTLLNGGDVISTIPGQVDALISDIEIAEGKVFFYNYQKAELGLMKARIAKKAAEVLRGKYVLDEDLLGLKLDKFGIVGTTVVKNDFSGEEFYVVSADETGYVLQPASGGFGDIVRVTFSEIQSGYVWGSLSASAEDTGGAGVSDIPEGYLQDLARIELRAGKLDTLDVEEIWLKSAWDKNDAVKIGVYIVSGSKIIVVEKLNVKAGESQFASVGSIALNGAFVLNLNSVGVKGGSAIGSAINAVEEALVGAFTDKTVTRDILVSQESYDALKFLNDLKPNYGELTNVVVDEVERAENVGIDVKVGDILYVGGDGGLLMRVEKVDTTFTEITLKDLGYGGTSTISFLEYKDREEEFRKISFDGTFWLNVQQKKEGIVNVGLDNDDKFTFDISFEGCEGFEVTGVSLDDVFKAGPYEMYTRTQGVLSLNLKPFVVKYASPKKIRVLGLCKLQGAGGGYLSGYEELQLDKSISVQGYYESQGGEESAPESPILLGSFKEIVEKQDENYPITSYPFSTLQVSNYFEWATDDVLLLKRDYLWSAFSPDTPGRFAMALKSDFEGQIALRIETPNANWMSQILSDKGLNPQSNYCEGVMSSNIEETLKCPEVYFPDGEYVDIVLRGGDAFNVIPRQRFYLDSSEVSVNINSGVPWDNFAVRLLSVKDDSGREMLSK